MITKVQIGGEITTNIIARTHIGARDLYNGVPELLGAVVKNIIYGDELTTTLVLEVKNRKEYSITIKQA